MKTTIATSLLLALSLSFALPAKADKLATAAFDKQVTITFSGYTGTSTLFGFPALVRLSDNSPSGFSYADCQADGSDIRFADSDGNAIPHEIDTWNPDGESTLWIRIPTLSGTTTAITMYYDATPAYLAAVEATAVWTGFLGVYHMTESIDADGFHEPDSTANAMDGLVPDSLVSAANTGAAGVVGSGFSKKNGTTYVQVPANSALGTLTAYATFSGWLMPVSGSWASLWNTKNSLDSSSQLWNKSNEGTSVNVNGAWNKLSIKGYANNSASCEMATTLTDGFWHCVTATYDGSIYTLYVDGTQVAQKDDGPSIVGSSSYPVEMWGRTGNYNSYMPTGSFDEFRITAGVRSPDWVKAEYDTVASASFASYDTVIDVPVPASLEIDELGTEYTATGDLDVIGRLLSLGTGSSASVRLQYGTASDALNQFIDLETAITSAPEVFTIVIPSATPGATYYYRLVASNNASENASTTISSFAIPSQTVLATAVSATSQNTLASLSGSVQTKGLGTTTVTLLVGDSANSLTAVDSKVVSASGAFSFERLLAPGAPRYFAFRATDDDNGVLKVSNTTDVGSITVVDTSTYTWISSADFGNWYDSDCWTSADIGAYGYPAGTAASVIFPANALCRLALTNDITVARASFFGTGSELTILGNGHTFTTTTAISLKGTFTTNTLDNVNWKHGSVTAPSDTCITLRNAATFDGEFTCGDRFSLDLSGESWFRGNQMTLNKADVDITLDNSVLYSFNNITFADGAHMTVRGADPQVFIREGFSIAGTLTVDLELPAEPYSRSFKYFSSMKNPVGLFSHGNGGGDFPASGFIVFNVVKNCPAQTAKGLKTYRLVGWDQTASRGLKRDSITINGLRPSIGEAATYSWIASADPETQKPQYLDVDISGALIGTFLYLQ